MSHTSMQTPRGKGDAGAQRPSSTQRTISEVMSREVDVVAPDASVVEAAGTMKTRNVGAIPVCDGGRLTGMITDRDITVKVVANRRDPAATPVREAMSHGIVYGYEDRVWRKSAGSWRSGRSVGCRFWTGRRNWPASCPSETWP